MKILTDYRMMTSQSLEWENATDNIHYRRNILSKLANTECIPSFWADFLIKFNNNPWLTALRLLLANRPYDIVVTGDFLVGRIYALLQTLIWWKRKPHLFLDFMLDDTSSNIFWKLKRMYQKEIFNRIDRIVVFSPTEVETYAKELNIPKEKFVFLPYHTNISKPHFVKDKSDYILSAGTSGRDYKSLLNAIRGTGIKLKIITRPENINGSVPLANVELIYNIPYFDYLNMISNSRFVVLPLKTHIRSLGMVVMLEAMSLGKAVLMTRAVSNIEYIRDGENGFFVDSNDPEKMREKILYLWEHPELCDRSGKQAVENVKSNWSFDAYAQSVLSVIHGMVSEENKKS